jgi:hypothetical protein
MSMQTVFGVATTSLIDFDIAKQNKLLLGKKL